MTAHARRDDPWTSWAAAHSIDVKPSQAAVLWVFENMAGAQRKALTLEEVVECVRAWRADAFSDSRIRTAVSELVADQVLYDTGTTSTTRSGRKARLIAKVTAPAQGTLL